MQIPVEDVVLEFHDFPDREEYLVIVEITNLYIGRVFRYKSQNSWNIEGAIRPLYSRHSATMFSSANTAFSAIQRLINNHDFDKIHAIAEKMNQAEMANEAYY